MIMLFGAYLSEVLESPARAGAGLCERVSKLPLFCRRVRGQIKEAT